MNPVDEALWSRLSPLLDQALDLEGAARDELVRSLRESDAELAGALERHLAEHDRAAASGFLAAPPASPYSLEGRTFGAYELVERIGSGGMGSVWRARRNDGRFEGDVALKLLHPSLLEERNSDRFRSEGSILSRLTHAGIARLYDAGVSVAGQPFLVLELVDGVRIDRFADAAGLPLRARIELFLQVADAVAYAHSNLVVHSDLKPSNVLVTRDGAAKLLDFGIATLVDQASGVAIGHTSTVAHALTPEYAAPEQLAGKAITTATDVYSLGLLLYELLTGAHPLAEPGASPADLVRALSEGEPRRMSESLKRRAPLSTRDRLARALAGDLDTIAAKALKRAPEERYPTVAAFADDLRRHLRSQPVQARPDRLGYRLRKLVARRRIEVAAAAFAAVALLAATAFSWRQARASAAERDRAIEELRRAEITNDFSGFLISEATPDGTPISKQELLARAEEMIDGRFADRPDLQAHMLLLLSSRYYDISDRTRWREVLNRAHGLAERTEDVRLRAVVGCELAMALADEEPERSRALLAAADAELATRDAADAATELARCSLNRAILANFVGEHERAIEAAERSLRYEAARPGPSGRGIDALNTLGLAQATLGRYEQANQTFEKLFAILTAERRTTTRAAMSYRHNWTLALYRAGQIRRALAESDVVLPLARKAGGGKVSPYTLSLRASLLSLTGRHEEAREIAAESIRNASATTGTQVPFWTWYTVARVHALAGRAAEADAALVELDRALTAIPAPASFLPATRDLVHAAVAIERSVPGSRRDDAERAIALARKALASLDRENGTARDRQLALLIVARGENDLGDSKAAAGHAEQTRRMAVEALGGFAHSRELGLAELEVARAAAGAGDHSAARAAFDRSLENLRDTLGPDAPETVRAERWAAASLPPAV